MTHTDTVTSKMADVVFRVWMGTVTVKSDFAREQAAVIAACSSEGYITTRIGTGLYVPSWLVTPVGLEFLEEHSPTVEF